MANSPGVRFSKDLTQVVSPTGDIVLQCDTSGKKIVGMIGGSLLMQLDANGLATKAGVPTAYLNKVAITTAGAGTYSAANLLKGIIERDPNGSARTDTTDTAANILAAIPTLSQTGDTFECKVINTADAAEAITIAGDTGVTVINAGQTIAQNESAILLFRRTSSTTLDLYILGA